MVWKLGDTIYKDFATHKISDASLFNADALPTIAVYEDNGGSGLNGASIANLSTGTYRVTIVATGANGFEEGKTYNAHIIMTMQSTSCKNMFSFTLEGKRVSELNDLAAGAAMALTSTYDAAKTAAQENTLNTKIPTALSFSSGNVNAESKVTAAPSDMALNSTVAKSATALDNTVWTGTKAGYVDASIAARPTLSSIEGSTVLAMDATVDAMGADLDFLIRFFTNKKLWNDTNKEWDIYDDAGTSVIAHWKPHIKEGGDVTMDAAAFASTDAVEVL